MPQLTAAVASDIGVFNGQQALRHAELGAEMSPKRRPVQATVLCLFGHAGVLVSCKTRLYKDYMADSCRMIWMIT